MPNISILVECTSNAVNEFHFKIEIYQILMQFYVYNGRIFSTNLNLTRFRLQTNVRELDVISPNSILL